MLKVYIKQNFQIWPKTKLSSVQSTVGLPLPPLPQIDPIYTVDKKFGQNPKEQLFFFGRPSLNPPLTGVCLTVIIWTMIFLAMLVFLVLNEFTFSDFLVIVKVKCLPWGRHDLSAEKVKPFLAFQSTMNLFSLDYFSYFFSSPIKFAVIFGPV